MMPPFVVFPTNRIAHFVEVSLYLFYLAQQVNLINKMGWRHTEVPHAVRGRYQVHHQLTRAWKGRK